MKYTYRTAVGNPKGKKTLARPRHKSEDNINTAL
jgi:hypothetical protein